MDNEGLYNANEPNRNDSWDWDTAKIKKKSH